MSFRIHCKQSKCNILYSENGQANNKEKYDCSALEEFGEINDDVKMEDTNDDYIRMLQL